jgi:hypothetical protein
VKPLLVALALALALPAALAQQTVFEDSQAVVHIDTSAAAKPIRNKELVTFAATFTFKAPVEDIVAGTRAYIYFTVECRQQLIRQVVSWVEVPGKPRSTRKVDDVVKTAKSAPFVPPTDQLSREIIA